MQTETAIQTDSILARLKARTAHQHQQTEDGVDLMDADFSSEDYRNLLVKFYVFYKSYESKMLAALHENPIKLNYEERLNAPKLFADLKNLGMTESEIANVETFNDLPTLDSAEKIFGSLYVIEGSTLGGQYISRHLKEKFGLDETNGIAFFSGYGKETGKMWNAFREAITAFAETSDDHEAIIKSANATFEKIGKALK
ncbi:MAG: biliverdin-producing heme oxygenase [Pyrinomonadaceae bacterium]